MEHLATLVDNNLVMPYDTPEEARFRLFESIRAYALEKLEAGGEADTVCARHAEHFASLAQEAREHLPGKRGNSPGWHGWKPSTTTCAQHSPG